MTQEEWLAIYYPVPASDATGSELEAAKHCLNKWTGLVEARSEGGPPVDIDASTCALCHRHGWSEEWTEISCADCVLYQIRDGTACCIQTAEEDLNNNPSPFDAWDKNQDPEPMVELLQRAVEVLESGVRE